MKFFNVVAAATMLTAAMAAPSPASEQPPASGLTKFAGTAKGTIDCNVATKVCEVACGDTLQLVCTLVAVWDSVFYGIEILAGFTINCTEKGCDVYCPMDGTVLCGANELLATFDGVWTVGESIIIDGLQDLLGGLTGGALPSLPASA